MSKDNENKHGELDLRKARRQLVAESTDFVQNSRVTLTRVQKNAIRYLISKVKPGDTAGQTYTFQFREFAMIMRYKSDSYTDIKKMIQALADKSWWKDAEHPDDDDKLMRWLNIVHTNEKKGIAIVSFHEDMFPYIYNLKEQYEKEGRHYITYMLQNISLMRNTYSPDLYEILRSYANNTKWSFELGTGTSRDIQRKIAKTDTKTGEPIIPKSWSNFAIFERDVLKPAKKEINLYSDIVIDYAPSKIDFAGNSHRKYVRIDFFISMKTSVEQKETDEIIDAEYKEIEDSYKYEQLTIESIFAKGREEAKEEEEFFKQKKELERSKHPIIKETLKGYSNEEIDHLYNEAVKHIEPGRVDHRNIEVWALDYISHYNDIVVATSNNTKTTPYIRLLDMVRKDYEAFASQITTWDIQTEKEDDREEDDFILEGINTKKPITLASTSSINDLDEEKARQMIKELQAYLDSAKEKND